MSRSIDTATSDCRLVRYGVYHPTKGWIGANGYPNGHELPCGSKPSLMENYVRARNVAIKAKAQLVTFDVTPCLRSWPGEEPKDTK